MWHAASLSNLSQVPAERRPSTAIALLRWERVNMKPSPGSTRSTRASLTASISPASQAIDANHVSESPSIRLELEPRVDQQDAWVTFPPLPPLLIAQDEDTPSRQRDGPSGVGTNFRLGTLRCDNRIAAVMQDSGLDVINTPLDIVATHVHASMDRDYTEVRLLCYHHSVLKQCSSLGSDCFTHCRRDPLPDVVTSSQFRGCRRPQKNEFGSHLLCF